MELVPLDSSTPTTVRDRFVIHHSPELAERYGFGGTHRRFSQRGDGYYGRLSVSCHSFDEARTVLDEGRADYLFLSPLFDSRSKRGYLSAFTHEETAAFMGTLSPDEKRRVIALGGVDADNIALCRDMGFGGAAMIGSVWALHNGLASDTAPTRDALLHAMDWADAEGIDYDCVVLLQPTSPLRRAEDISGAMAL